MPGQEGETSKGRSVLRIVLINIEVFAACALLILLALEAGSRVYLNHWASDEQFTRYASHTQLEKRAKDRQTPRPFAPHRYLGFMPTPNFVDGPNRHNSLGYRGEEVTVPKPEGEFRIVCIGGSTTYTSSVENYRDAYPAQLETQLKERGYEVRVVNAGSVNWMSHETLINLQFRVLDLEPDLVIVYHSVNDLLGRLIWPPEAYTSDNRGVRTVAVTQWFMPSILEYSTFARALLLKLGLATPHSAGSDTLNKLSSAYLGTALRQQHLDGTYPSGIFADHPVSEILSRNKPVFFQRNIESIVAILQQHHITPIIATFAYSPHFPDNEWSSHPELTAGYGEMSQVLKAVAKKTQAALFDFAAEFPQDARYFVDGVHLNEEGARLKATYFADYLERSGLLRRADSSRRQHVKQAS